MRTSDWRLSIVTGAALLAWNCGDSSPTPVAPSAHSVVVTSPITEGQPPRSGVASDGFGAQGLVEFPGREQAYQSGQELNTYYRDVVKRGSVGTCVDLEGWIVWIQEYLRYRVNYCNHVEASNKVFMQIAGGGVQPVCRRGTYIRLTGGANACACWIGTITVWVDGVRRGTLTCNTSLDIAVSPGTHSVEACDIEGCLKDNAVPVAQDETYDLELYCTGAKHSFAGVRR